MISLRCTVVQPSCAPGRGVDCDPMRGRIPLFVLLASALAFLASLFLPWRETAAAPDFVSGVQGLLNQFAGERPRVNGWVDGRRRRRRPARRRASSSRPSLPSDVRSSPRGCPFGSLGVALAYFAVAVAVEVHTLQRVFVGGFTGHPAMPPRELGLRLLPRARERRSRPAQRARLSPERSLAAAGRRRHRGRVFSASLCSSRSSCRGSRFAGPEASAPRDREPGCRDRRARPHPRRAVGCTAKPAGGGACRSRSRRRSSPAGAASRTRGRRSSAVRNMDRNRLRGLARRARGRARVPAAASRPCRADWPLSAWVPRRF